MKLLSVNIGIERTQQCRDYIETTGIYKIPVERPVAVGYLGMGGDVICDRKNHGGPDQAVYVYGSADYEWWSRELGRELSPGTFGENLTVSGLESARFHVGDYLQVGAVNLQVTSPRIPCGTFATRMTDPQWVKKFRRAERPGLYCRVLREGLVKAGDPVTIEKYDGRTLPILEMYCAFYDKHRSEEMLRRYLEAPIDIRSRVDLDRELRQLLGEGPT